MTQFLCKKLQGTEKWETLILIIDNVMHINSLEHSSSQYCNFLAEKSKKYKKKCRTIHSKSY